MSQNNTSLLPVESIRLSKVSKKYPLHGNEQKEYLTEDFWALKDVDLGIKRGEVLGIIGRNGAGKTTLLSIIAGTLAPTQGQVVLGGKAVGLFNLGIGFQDELSGQENIFLNGAILGASHKELAEKLNAIIEFSELGNFINMPLGSYSQGMRLRLGFSIVANLDFEILVIDEVLAVGDALFQNKCFERLIDFKRQGKTLVITTQGLDFIERLSDRVVLLDHGALLFDGPVQEGINRYRNLLNTEKFFVGLPQGKRPGLIENTKKWADNTSDWGHKFGGKEITIDTVEFIDQRKAKVNRVNTGEPLTVRVVFTAKDKVENPHFGVAIFKPDGTYCYGPNTDFDGYRITQITSGQGYFSLDYRKLWLAPGEYKVSVAIWDKNEVVAFDYHYGYYDLIVTGPHRSPGGFLNVPFKTECATVKERLTGWFTGKNHLLVPGFDLPPAGFPVAIAHPDLKIESLRFLDREGCAKNVFMTNDPVKFVIQLKHSLPGKNNLCLWCGVFRDDGVYCQGMNLRVGKGKNYAIIFPRLPLLPGGYRVTVGIWDAAENRFLVYQPGAYSFQMVFDKQDHGTVYLEHAWEWGSI